MRLDCAQRVGLPGMWRSLLQTVAAPAVAAGTGTAAAGAAPIAAGKQAVTVDVDSLSSAALAAQIEVLKLKLEEKRAAEKVASVSVRGSAPAVDITLQLPKPETLAASAKRQEAATGAAPIVTSSYVKSALRDIVGGTMGGFGLVAVGHPFDTMKVRLQTQPAHAPLYNGLFDCVRKTIQKEGIRGFYSGVFSPLCGQMFLNATQFFAWGQSSALVSRTTGRAETQFEISDFAIAGLMTALACAVVENPIDFFKSQLQVQVFRPTPQFTTVPQAFKYVINNHGIRGAYQGLSATIMRNIPFRSLYFGTYATTRYMLLDGKDVSRKDTPTWVQLASGGMAGLTQWFACYPLDVIKSTMQTDAIVRSERKYSGWLDCVRKMYATGGVRMFFRGWTPCMLRSFPANAVCYFLYEKTVHALGDTE